MLKGPDEVVEQILLTSDPACKRLRLRESAKKRWTHGLYFRGGVPEETLELCEDLSSWLSIPTTENVDISLSLDWYKKIDSSGDLKDTDIGELVHFRKYTPYPNSNTASKQMNELVDLLSEAIQAHPLYANADFISTPPGHKGDGSSFGELLGSSVARKTKKDFVRMQGPVRPQRKEGSVALVRDDFSLQQVVPGTLILIDDVFRSGTTLESAARAARRAGASQVLTLTAVRTLRT